MGSAGTIDGNYPFSITTASGVITITPFLYKNQSDSYPSFLIMANDPIFLINYHILYFQMYYQYLFSLPKYQNNVSIFC